MAQGKHDGKPGKRRALLIVEIICVIVVIVCVALIFMQVSKYWTANNEFNAITEEYDRNPNALVTDNPNCVGWVSVADTRIDYPVMYTPNDPEYYLHRNFEGNESAAGTPFLGKGCLLDGNSAIIYGHNMNDGSMFASLRNFDNPEFGMNHVIEYNTIDGGNRIWQLPAARLLVRRPVSLLGSGGRAHRAAVQRLRCQHQATIHVRDGRERHLR